MCLTNTSPSLISLQSPLFFQNIIVLAFPLIFPQGIGPKIFTDGKSRAILSTVVDPLNPEIFALEVNNGPVYLIRD